MKPETVPVELIYDEVMAVLRSADEGRLHPDGKILLASLLFADDEGVADIKPGALQFWSRRSGARRASTQFVDQRIGHLIGAGLLAPGSTATELRSMVGRKADEADEDEEVAA